MDKGEILRQNKKKNLTHKSGRDLHTRRYPGGNVNKDPRKLRPIIQHKFALWLEIYSSVDSGAMYWEKVSLKAIF